jgi:hypothetical protein
MGMLVLLSWVRHVQISRHWLRLERHHHRLLCYSVKGQSSGDFDGNSKQNSKDQLIIDCRESKDVGNTYILRRTNLLFSFHETADVW